MKWYICNKDQNLLCWAGILLEFDTEDSAKRFLNSYLSQTTYDSPQFYYHIFGVYFIQDEIKDSVSINATNLKVEISDTKPNGHLVFIE